MKPKSRRYYQRRLGRILRRTLLWLFPLGAAAFVWFGAIYFALRSRVPDEIRHSDVESLLFGGATFAVFLFSILLTIIAIIGWQRISEVIGKQVAEAFESRQKQYDKELRGRYYAVLAFMTFTLAYDSKRLEVIDSEKLELVIEYNRFAVRDFPREKEHYYVLLNNLVYTMCLRNLKGDGDYVLSNVGILLEKGREPEKLSMLLTACRAIFQYSSEKRQIQSAKEILRELSVNDHEKILPSHKREAMHHLAWLRVHRPEV